MIKETIKVCDNCVKNLPKKLFCDCCGKETEDLKVIYPKYSFNPLRLIEIKVCKECYQKNDEENKRQELLDEFKDIKDYILDLMESQTFNSKRLMDYIAEFCPYIFGLVFLNAVMLILLLRQLIVK